MRLSFTPSWSAAVPWAAASLPFLFMVAWFWNRGPGLGADDFAQTLMHAEALLEGRPYDDTPLITTPFDAAPPVQPPGLPLLVAGTVRLSGEFDWNVMRLIMAVVALPFFLLAGRYFAREQGLAVGLAVMVMLTVGLAAKAPSGATHVQPDLVFAGLIWAVVFMLDDRSSLTWPEVFGIFLLGSLAMAFRFLGAVLVPTIALFAILGRREGRFKLLVPLGVWGVAGLAVAIWLGPSAFAAAAAQVSLAGLWNGIRPMINEYAYGAVEAHLYPLPWNAGNDVFHVISLCVSVGGVVVWTRTRWRSCAWLFMASYLVALLLAYNRTGRYLMPLYPILLFSLLHGMRVGLSSLRPQWPTGRAYRLAGLAGTSIAAMALTLSAVREPREGGYLVDLPDVQALFAHLTAAGPAESTRVAFVKPRILAWSTGIPALPILTEPPPQTLAEMERLRITHVVLDRLQLEPLSTSRMLETVASAACQFESTFDNGSFVVYRLLPECRDDGA